MSRARRSLLIDFDPEIEKTLRQLRKASRIENMAQQPNQQQNNQADPPPEDNRVRSLHDYAMPTTNGAGPSIVRPAITNNFEIKPGIIQMIQHSVQFGGHPHEDPNEHIQNFLEICDTFCYNNVTDDTVRLRLFPFSLKEKAKCWLFSLPTGSITTWDEMS